MTTIDPNVVDTHLALGLRERAADLGDEDRFLRQVLATIAVTPQRRWPAGFGRRTSLVLVAAALLALVAGSLVAGGFLRQRPAPLPADAWTTTGSMLTPRDGHTATLLDDGRVLVTGGDGDGNALASAELYDPVSGIWTPAGDMTEVGVGHTATLLAGGNVLVVGGLGNSGDGTTSAALYDPASGTWTATGRTIAAHAWHTATLLADGRVLVAGGFGGDAAVARAELYDPGSGTWTATGAMTKPRGRGAATLLSDGRVLVVGGWGEGNDDSAASAELYDPTADTWTATGSMSEDRSGFAATALSDGTVLVTGGAMVRPEALVRQRAPAELYDPATGSWKATGDMHVRGRDHTDTVLSDGRILVTGGQIGSAVRDVSAAADLYDPTTGVWTATAAMAEARASHTATLLLDGSVLVAGGRPVVGLGGSSHELPFVLSSAELYGPGADAGR